jgi:hypothetical protein
LKRFVLTISRVGSRKDWKIMSMLFCESAEGKPLEDSNLKGLHLDISLELLALQSECEFGDNQRHGKVVLLDARNTYETRIGKFLLPKGVQTLEPNIRQYSDLPAWIDRHADELRGNHILM